MPNNRLQLTRTLVETTNHAEVQRVAKPNFRLDVAPDAPADTVEAVIAFFKRYEQDATLKTSPKSNRFIESGINLVYEDSVVLHLPKSATKAMASRRLSSALVFEPVHPMLHQRVAIKEYVEKEPQTYVLNFTMGAGKTLATILMISAMKPPPKRVLIVCSNTLIGHWIKEIGRTSQKEGETLFTITGYSEFRKMVGSERKHFIRRYDVVVVDEAHYYRNLTPCMLSDVAALREAKRLILLTGTILQNDKEEREGMLYLMGLDGGETLQEAEKVLGSNSTIFYYNPAEHGSTYTQSAYPKLIMHVEKVSMAPLQTLEYLMSESKHTRIGTYTISTARCNSYNSLTRAISNTMTSGDMSPKFEKVIENITSGKYPGPHVVYSHYRPKGVETVEKELKRRKKNGKALLTVLMTGSTPARERDEMIAQYNRGEIDVFFITDAAREGIDLHGTGTMHLIEPHENVHSEKQTQSRVARHNSHNSLPPAERRVNIIKYISIFPSLKQSDRAALDEYFEKEYQLESKGNFDIVKEMTKLITEHHAKETVDEQYERTNVEKARELQPWIDMLHRVGFRKDAVGVDPVIIVAKPVVEESVKEKGGKKESKEEQKKKGGEEKKKRVSAVKMNKVPMVITEEMREIVRVARKSVEAMILKPLPKKALVGEKRKKEEEEKVVEKEDKETKKRKKDIVKKEPVKKEALKMEKKKEEEEKKNVGQKRKRDMALSMQ